MAEQINEVDWGPAQEFHDAANKGGAGPYSLPLQIARSRIWSPAEAAAFIGVSKATLERLVASQRGPPIVRLSARRCGFRIGDVVDWLDARASNNGEAT